MNRESDTITTDADAQAIVESKQDAYNEAMSCAEKECPDEITVTAARSIVKEAFPECYDHRDVDSNEDVYVCSVYKSYLDPPYNEPLAVGTSHVSMFIAWRSAWIGAAKAIPDYIRPPQA
jgi:hypothetical protein